MNEVWRAVVNTIIVALMTQALSVVYVMAQCWEVLHRLDVMRFQSFMTAAYLTGIVIALKYGFLPGKVIGATSTLGIPMIAALGYALAFYTAIGVLIQRGIGAPKLFAANLTSAKNRVGEGFTPMRTIDSPPNVRRGSFHLLATMGASNCYLLRLRLCRASTRTVPLLGILRPTAVGFLGYDLLAGLAGVQFHTLIIAKR